MSKALKKYKYDILICALIVIISIIENVHLYFDPYWGGLKNSSGFGPFLMILFYEPLKICIILCAILRIFYYFKSKQKLGSYIITILFTIIVFIGSWMLPFTIGQPGAVRFLNGYEKWVKKNVETDKIQEWLVSGEADRYMNEIYTYDFPDDLPDFMKNFNRQYIYFDGHESERGKSIVFEWGSALVGHWGIVISLPTNNTQQDGVIKESESYYEYRRSIKPGIYIFDGG